MIAEDYDYNHQPKSSIPKGTAISCILNCFKTTTPFFKQVLTQPDLVKPLNENKLTQLFIEQLRIQLRKKGVTFDVGNQYSDVFFKTKGIPDFYFHALEEGKTAIPLFIVETKRLPAPQTINEKEYVIGQNNNGGIERFKSKKHGKGLSECGLLGFIEEENSTFWVSKINEWIKQLVDNDNDWVIEELLTKIEDEAEFSYLISLVRTDKNTDVSLHHFWIYSLP
jgi:hypothetical protein